MFLLAKSYSRPQVMLICIIFFLIYLLINREENTERAQAAMFKVVDLCGVSLMTTLNVENL